MVVFVTEPCFPNTFDLKSIKNRVHSILLHLKLNRLYEKYKLPGFQVDFQSLLPVRYMSK